MYSDTFEGFEGVKRVKNTRHSNAEDIYALLENYKDSLPNLTYNIGMDESDIIIQTEGKYHIYVTILDDEIVVERKLDSELIFNEEIPKEEETQENTNPTPAENPHDEEIVHVNRLIEQLYDLLKDYENNDVVTEHITSVKEVYTMKEGIKKILNGLIPSGISYNFVNKDNRITNIADQNFLNQVFCLRDADTSRELYSINYKEAQANKYIIIQPPFSQCVISKDAESTKSILTGTKEGKVIKISGDYTDNHFLLEYDELVIGAVDCKDPTKEKLYTIEVNNTEFTPLIFTLAVIVDLYKSQLKDDK